MSSEVVMAIRWLLIGLWTVAVATFPQWDDEWVPVFTVIGGIIVIAAVFVLFCNSAGGGI